MTDRELLEKAAIAADMDYDPESAWPWNPLEDDGQALRLAVKLMITPHIDGNLTDAEGMNGNFTESHFDDPYAATRRAIVRAAAAIGETL